MIVLNGLSSRYIEPLHDVMYEYYFSKLIYYYINYKINKYESTNNLQLHKHVLSN